MQYFWVCSYLNQGKNNAKDAKVLFKKAFLASLAFISFLIATAKPVAFEIKSRHPI